MFRNAVFKPSVNTKKWLKSALIRALKTVCQSAVSVIGVSATLGSVDWKLVISTALLSGIVSILTSVGGIPEVESEG